MPLEASTLKKTVNISSDILTIVEDYIGEIFFYTYGVIGR